SVAINVAPIAATPTAAATMMRVRLFSILESWATANDWGLVVGGCLEVASPRKNKALRPSGRLEYSAEFGGRLYARRALRDIARMNVPPQRIVRSATSDS